MEYAVYMSTYAILGLYLAFNLENTRKVLALTLNNCTRNLIVCYLLKLMVADLK